MLDYAYFHKEKLKRTWAKAARDPRFQFIRSGSCTDLDFYIKDNTWSTLRCLSLSNKGEAVGWFEVSVSRETYDAHSMRIINMLGHTNITFANDMKEFFRRLFLVWNFKKVKFAVAVGNPAEAMYDKFVAGYGGRVVGVNYRDIRLSDGKLYDMKLYEILREDCLNAVGMSDVTVVVK